MFIFIFIYERQSVGGYGIPAIPTQSAVHSYCQCDCHHSIGLYTHVCVGMAGMPYPPTDTHSSVFKKPVLLFFCLFKNNMFSCPLVFPQQHVLMFFCLFKQQHVLMFFCLFKQQHVLMFSCLSKTTCSHVLLSFQTTTCSHVLLSFKNNMFFCLSPKRTMFSRPTMSLCHQKKTAESNAPSR